MRAIVCTAHGTLDNSSVAEIDAPSLGDDVVIVAVEAAGVSFVDALMVVGIAPAYPSVHGRSTQ